MHRIHNDIKTINNLRYLRIGTDIEKITTYCTNISVVNVKLYIKYFSNCIVVFLLEIP